MIGLEQFELGHSRGASHDTSRILRHSYHTPGYVRLTCEAYDDWARLEAASGESLVTVVGGLDLFPPDCVIQPDDYVASMREVGIDFEELDVDEISRRWPVFRPPAGTLGLFQERGAIVPAAVLDTGPADEEIIASADPSAIARWRPVPSIPLREVPGGWDGPATDGTVSLSTEHDDEWTLAGTDDPPDVAFGWATSFPATGQAIEVREGGALPAKIQVALLTILWLVALWVTRKPVAR